MYTCAVMSPGQEHQSYHVYPFEIPEEPFNRYGAVEMDDPEDPRQRHNRFLIESRNYAAGNAATDETTKPVHDAGVYRCWDRKTGQYLMLKMASLTDPDQPNTIRAEAMAMEKARREAGAVRVLSPREYFHQVSNPFKPESQAPVSIFMIAYEGNLLEHSIKNNQLSLNEILTITNQLGTEIDLMAQADPPIFHRDLKIDNLSWDGHNVGIFDFGIATGVFEIGKFPIGTPGFMSRQRYQGGNEISLTDEVWALGSIVYKLLTQKNLNDGLDELDSIKQANMLEILGIGETELQRLKPVADKSGIDLEQMKSFFNRCFDIPENRFQSGQELASAFSQLFSGADQQINFYA